MCMPLLRRRAFCNLRAPCVDRRAVVDAWRAHIAKCAAPQGRNDFLNALSEQFSRERCSGMLSDTQSSVAAPCSSHRSPRGGPRA
eukprot:2923867-Lingulodinium_polyedra.AAC.1